MTKLNTRPMAAGRVLSAANESRIRDARDALDAVLSKLESEMQEDSDLLQHMNRAALKPGHIRINADAGTRSAEIKIYGDIGGGWWDEGITAESIANEIDALDVDELNVRINSGGGLVFEGIAIYNAFARHSANVIMHIDGIAASIASVIAMAGDEIRISEGSHLMIHKPWSGVMGDATAMRKEADVLDTLEAGLIDIYVARTESKRADVQAWVDGETWFLGQAAVDAGFADVMVPAKTKKAASSALLNLFKKTPQNLLAAARAPEIREFETFLRDGEGLSNAQAKRIAAQVARGLDRDDPPTPQVKPLRDVGGESADATKSALKALAQRITQFTTTIKE
jgi:ATP-dependent Clp protease protease subunit